MKRKKTHLLIGMALITLLWLLTIVPIPSCAAVVWEDNFNDGNLDGWNIVLGDFDPTNGYANATVEDRLTVSPGPYIRHLNMLNRSSSVAVGTWSFDWWVWQTTYLDTTTRQVNDIHFMATGGLYLEAESAWLNTTGYSIALGFTIGAGGGDNPSFKLKRNNHGDDSAISLYVTDGEWNEWYHFNVTRDAEGEFNVWINGEHVMSKTDTTFDASTHFAAQMLHNQRLDNVVVSDTIDLYPPGEEPTTTSPTPTPTPTEPGPTGPIDPMLLVAIGGVGVVIVVAAVVCTKRR